MDIYNRIALDNSLNKHPLGIGTKYMAVGTASLGVGNLFADTNWQKVYPLYAGANYEIDAKDNVFLDAGPQPGKFLDLIFSDNPIILNPGTYTDTRNISYGSFYSNWQAGGWNTTLITEAQNINGVNIGGGVMSLSVGTNTATDYSRIALTTFFASLGNFTIDGFDLFANALTTRLSSHRIEPIFIPPKFGISISTFGVNGFAGIYLPYQVL